MRIGQTSLAPSGVFLTFFLLGPVFAAALQFLLLNILLWVISHQSQVVVTPDKGSFTVLIGAMEASGLIEAILVFLFGFPASLLVAAFATLSYLSAKRVTVLAVVAAVVTAVFLEGVSAPATYFGYFASHGVRGPWRPDELGPDETGAIFLVWLLHLLPALMCWWFVRDLRKPPLT